jgi:hypothetical protein
VKLPKSQRIHNLEKQLFNAEYGVQYYNTKSAGLTIQMEQLSKIASEMPSDVLINYLARYLSQSRAQLLQDLIIGFIYENKSIGFFVNLEQQTE